MMVERTRQKFSIWLFCFLTVFGIMVAFFDTHVAVYSADIKHGAKDPISLDKVPVFDIGVIALQNKQLVGNRLIYRKSSPDLSGPSVIDNRIEIWSGGKTAYPSGKRTGITVSAKASPMKMNRTGTSLPILSFNLIASDYQESEKFQWGYNCTAAKPLNIYGTWQQIFWTKESTKQNFNDKLVHFFVYAMLEVDANVPIKAGDYTGTVDWLTAEVGH
jgi:hypothetical protein